jgi:peptide-methionine (R)-S-oxide reductase
MRTYTNFLVLATILTAIACAAGFVVVSWPSHGTPPLGPSSAASVDKAKGQSLGGADGTDPWKAKLTDEQYRITRQKGAEAPFSGKYVDHHATGTYKCVCCGARLFDSSAKFDSNTGWPSFYNPVDDQCVETAIDSSLYTVRTEVICRKCKAHLGHVFDDAPRTNDGGGPRRRYCIKSAALEFEGTEPHQETGG